MKSQVPLKSTWGFLETKCTRGGYVNVAHSNTCGSYNSVLIYEAQPQNPRPTELEFHTLNRWTTCQAVGDSCANLFIVDGNLLIGFSKFQI